MDGNVNNMGYIKLFKCKKCGYEHEYRLDDIGILDLLERDANGWKREDDPEYKTFLDDIQGGKYGAEIKRLIGTAPEDFCITMAPEIFKCYGCNRVYEIKERKIKKDSYEHHFHLEVSFNEACPACGNDYAFKKYLGGAVSCPNCNELSYEIVSDIITRS